MTPYTSIYDAYEEDATFTASQAFKTCQRHKVEIFDMVSMLGCHPEYNCHAVFEFLGY